MTNSQLVIDGITSCIPPGIPIPFKRVIETQKMGDQGAVATVEMFDGHLGVIEVSRVPFGSSGLSTWMIAWKDFPGGAINWNGTEWERVPHIIDEGEHE